MDNLTYTVSATLTWLPEPLISNKIADIVVYTLVVGVGSLVSLLGTTGNLLNIIVFLSQGVDDSIGLKFLFRSLLDFTYCFLIVVGSLFMLVYRVNPNLTALDSLSFAYSLGMTAEKIYFTSIIIIVCISVERCACIIFPFQIKTVFTKTRSLITVIAIFVCGIILLIPDYLTAGLSWANDSSVRSMRIQLWQSPDRIQFEIPKEIIIAAIVPVLAGATTTLSTVLMILAIKSSNKFRRSHVADSNREFYHTMKDANGKHDKQVPISLSDVKQAKIVILVNVVFVACSIPDYVIVVAAIVKSYMADFSLLATAGIYRNVVEVINDVAYVFEALNCAMTFLVYYASSCNFRQTFRSIVDSHSRL